MLQFHSKDWDIWNTSRKRTIGPADVSRFNGNSNLILNTCSFEFVAVPLFVVLFFKWPWFLDTVVCPINCEKTQLPLITNKPLTQLYLTEIIRTWRTHKGYLYYNKSVKRWLVDIGEIEKPNYLPLVMIMMQYLHSTAMPISKKSLPPFQHLQHVHLPCYIFFKRKEPIAGGLDLVSFS